MSRSFDGPRRVSDSDRLLDWQWGPAFGATIEGGLEQAEKGDGDVQGYAVAPVKGGEVGAGQGPQALGKTGEGHKRIKEAAMPFDLSTVEAQAVSVWIVAGIAVVMAIVMIFLMK
jgi:hypothetical protein